MTSARIPLYNVVCPVPKEVALGRFKPARTSCFCLIFYYLLNLKVSLMEHTYVSLLTFLKIKLQIQSWPEGHCVIPVSYLTIILRNRVEYRLILTSSRRDSFSASVTTTKPHRNMWLKSAGMFCSVWTLKATCKLQAIAPNRNATSLKFYDKPSIRLSYSNTYDVKPEMD